MKYSCGLIFNEDKTEILLVRKRRPSWQIGMFNGIGGKVDGYESALECMIRKSKEETTIIDENWREIAKLRGDDLSWCVVFFAIYNQDFKKISPLTDELLYPIMIKDIFNRQWYFYNSIIKNLRVIISLALDSGIQLPVPAYFAAEK